MPKEIERKYLVDHSKLPNVLPKPLEIIQGYVSTRNASTVRVRLCNDKGFLTLKGPTNNFTRDEYEYEVPKSDAIEMLSGLCDGPLVKKERFEIEHEGHLWEVDFFKGENFGLVLAEIELQSENEEFVLPAWITEDVTFDKRFSNNNLRKKSFNTFQNSYPNYVLVTS